MDNAARILVVSLHKCGTHLLIGMLERVGLHPVWMNDQYERYTWEHLARLAPDQYILTHYPPSHPEVYGRIEEGAVKAVLNYRDPRDACVSSVMWMGSENTKVTSSVREFTKKVNAHFEDQDAFLESAIRCERLNPIAMPFAEGFRLSRSLLFHPAVHKVRFEDLVGESGGGGTRIQQEMAINDLLRFLETAGDASELAREACNPQSHTFARGRVGSHREVFKRHHHRLFQELHFEILRDYGYR